MKKSPHHTGRAGERLARRWLAGRGFTILHTNWRAGRYEIDIVACKEGIVHVVEVKTLCASHFGFPEQKLTPRKMNHLVMAAGRLMDACCLDGVAIDLLSIQRTENGICYHFFEDIAAGYWR